MKLFFKKSLKIMLCLASISLSNGVLPQTKKSTLPFYIALKQQNVQNIFTYLEQVSDPDNANYGNYMTHDEIRELVSPDLQDVIPIMQFTTNANCTWFGDMIKCEHNPGNLSQFPLVEFVEHAPLLGKKFNKLPTHPQDKSNYIGREVLLSLYNIPDSIAKNSSVCAVEYQNNSGYSSSDLYQHQILNNENNNTVKHTIGTDTGSDLETQLDIQMMSQTFEDVQLWFWGSPAWLYTFAIDFMNTDNVPSVLSMSWGWSETDQCSITNCVTSKQYVDRVNVEYAKLGLRGITIVVASGDAGAPGRTDEMCDSDSVHAVFPGGSPYVTSVGATFVEPSVLKKEWKTPLCQNYGCNDGTRQFPTNFVNQSWTSGGGFSNYSLRPKWQDSFVTNYLNSGVHFPSSCNKSGRAYPDVAAVGHNCPIVSQGEVAGVDGTSCSAPIFATILAILDDYQKARGRPGLGFANPLLYKMHKTFTDITMGNNHCTEYQCCDLEYGYLATRGWDAVSGLGTPNVGLMIQWLEKNL